ncbi:MAG: helix-turn-helix domain-containing protein [Candidatus Omnitrophota bacterium]|jgi:predicted transcriptional regulator
METKNGQISKEGDLLKAEVVANKEVKEKQDLVVSPKTAYANLSLAELAKQLEIKIVDPATVDKKDLMKCALFFKSRGYSSEEIADHLKVDVRTVQRYIQQMRLENSLEFGPDFQRRIVREVIDDYAVRQQRLLKLSYAEDLSSYEQAKILFMCHQLQLSSMMLLERLGYLNKATGTSDLWRSTNKAQVAKEDKMADDPLVKKIKELNSNQQAIMSNFMISHNIRRSKKHRATAEKMINDYIAYNKKDREEHPYKYLASDMLSYT